MAARKTSSGKGMMFQDPGVASFDGGLVARKRTMNAVSIMMGKACRSPITGEVTFSDKKELLDFGFVDLAVRSKGIIGGTSADLEKDPYIFKAIPLMTRTWIYSTLVNSRTSWNSKHDPNESIKKVLSENCCDAPISTGLPSPLLYYVPGAIGTSLTGSRYLVVAMLALIAFLLFVAKMSNSWTHYRLARLYSLPLRCSFLALVVVRLDFSTVTATAGFLLTFLAVAADLVTGDFLSFWNYGMNCSYELVRELEGRLFVCKRKGAWQWEDYFGYRGVVPPEVSGLATWSREDHLIADIGDIICELRPLVRSDWERLQSRCLVTGAVLDYLCINAIDLHREDENYATDKLAEGTDMVVEDVEDI